MDVDSSDSIWNRFTSQCYQWWIMNLRENGPISLPNSFGISRIQTVFKRLLGSLKPPVVIVLPYSTSNLVPFVPMWGISIPKLKAVRGGVLGPKLSQETSQGMTVPLWNRPDCSPLPLCGVQREAFLTDQIHSGLILDFYTSRDKFWLANYFTGHC